MVKQDKCSGWDTENPGFIYWDICIKILVVVGRGQVASTRRKRKPVKIIFMNDFDLGESRDNGTNFR